MCQQMKIETRYKLLAECVIGFLVAALLAYGLAVTVDKLEFFYGAF